MVPTDPLHVASLFVKLAHNEPMMQVSHLELSPVEGIRGDVNPAALSPRQVCIAVAGSLREHEIKPHGSRANLVVDGPGSGAVRPGSMVAFGAAKIRITMACEPCVHGAHMADAPTVRFRNIVRYLAVVMNGGVITEGVSPAVYSRVFDPAPDDFRTRCAWALDRLPAGRVVTSVEFLAAIGASKSYARALPRWLNYARTLGKPVHRVLTASLTPPSWAPNALALLESEGATSRHLEEVRYPLTESLWFDHGFGEGTVQDA